MTVEKRISIISIISEHLKLKTNIDFSYYNDMNSISSKQQNNQIVMKQNVIRFVPHNIYKQRAATIRELYYP